MFKGIFLHSISKILLVISSYAIHFFLGKALTPAEYGIVGTLVTLLDFDYLFLDNGVRQALSRGISQDVYDKKDLVKKGLLFQSAMIMLVFAVNFFGAPGIARILNDAELTQYIRYAAFIIPLTGLYIVALGVFNGFRMFQTEAGIVSVYPLLKLSVIPLVAFVFADPILGTEAGFFLAALAVCMVAMVLLWSHRRLYKNGEKKISLKTYAKSAMSYSLLFSVGSIIVNMDTLFVKAITADNRLVGFYTGASTFSKVPYHLLTAFFLVVLPVVSRYRAQGEHKKAAGAIREVISVILALVLPIVAILCGSSSAALQSFYQPEYAMAGPTLSLLALGTFCLGMMMVFCMIVSATGRERFTALLAVGIAVLYFGLAVFLTKTYSIIGMAGATLISSAAALCIVASMAIRLFGNVFEKKHLYLLLANLALFGVTRALFAILPEMGLAMLALIYLVLYGLCLLILVFCRLLQIKQIKDMVHRRKTSKELEETSQNEN